MADENLYQQASIKTANDLRSVAHSLVDQNLTRLTLPEVNEAVDLVAQMLPAGNVPGIILNNLARLRGQAPEPDRIRRDIHLLFDGIQHLTDLAIYSAFFAGPATVLWGYQQLLRLAGKDIQAAFPNGIWQFYVEYELREDTARHANETHGFDTILGDNHIFPTDIDRMTAWVMAAASVLHQYDALLANEWRERVYVRVLNEVTEDNRHEKLYKQWEKQRPYGRGQDAKPGETYAAYRKRLFDTFLEPHLTSLSQAQASDWVTQVGLAKSQQLPAYQAQMSILAYLQPEAYYEKRTPITLESARIGLIFRGAYYLLPITSSASGLVDVRKVRSQIAKIYREHLTHDTNSLVPLARAQRPQLARGRATLTGEFAVELDLLRHAPILLNFDQANAQDSLVQIRQGERGIGDHALTIFDTGETFVFDQSHIFFDGAWGAVLAEVMTNEAVSWAVYLNQLAKSQPGARSPYRLNLDLTPADRDVIAKLNAVSPEVGAENSHIELGQLLSLRRLFKQRSDLIQLTVNDLLVLYRALHAVSYTLSPHLEQRLHTLATDEALAEVARLALTTLTPTTDAPAVLIPIDASQNNPIDRLYPMNFQVPLDELDIWARHKATLGALRSYREATVDRGAEFDRFYRLQRDYLATLAGFGSVLSQAKVIANAGEDVSLGSLKLMAHLPPALQQFLSQVPDRFELLNDIIKGREIFSNVGAVHPSSTLTRFITAKDDNDRKELGWGIITDANGVMHVSLRDFRQYVGQLVDIGHNDLAKELAQHYLDTYADGFNTYIAELKEITVASRETKSQK